jgi:hypothetical protein
VHKGVLLIRITCVTGANALREEHYRFSG